MFAVFSVLAIVLFLFALVFLIFILTVDFDYLILTTTHWTLAVSLRFYASLLRFEQKNAYELDKSNARVFRLNLKQELFSPATSTTRPAKPTRR